MTNATAYWFTANNFGEDEQALDAKRKRKFRETNDVSALEGQDNPDGLYMTTLPNDERCTTGGGFARVSWKYVGIQVADKTHRRATAEEIRKEFERQDANKAALAKAEDALQNRRTVSRIRP